MKQPRKATLREWLRAAADTIEAQKAEIDRLQAALAESVDCWRVFAAGVLLGLLLAAAGQWVVA